MLRVRTMSALTVVTVELALLAALVGAETAAAKSGDGGPNIAIAVNGDSKVQIGEAAATAHDTSRVIVVGASSGQATGDSSVLVRGDNNIAQATDNITVTVTGSGTSEQAQIVQAEIDSKATVTGDSDNVSVYNGSTGDSDLQ